MDKTLMDFPLHLRQYLLGVIQLSKIINHFAMPCNQCGK